MDQKADGNRLAGTAGAAQDRGLGELIRELAGESTTLVRQEIALARAELGQNVRELGRDAGRVATGGAVAGVGGLVLVAFLVALLGDLLGDNYWLSSLIVALLLLGVGGFLAFRAVRGMREVELAPQETLASLRSTQAWAKEEAAEIGSTLRGEGRADDDGHALHAGGDGAGPAYPRNRVAHLVAEPSRRPAAPAAAASRGAGRGRGAEPKGPLWKRVLAEIKEDEISGEAQRVAYNAVMALPPTLIALLSLVGIFGRNQVDWLTGQMQSAMPEEAWGLVADLVTDVVEGGSGGILSVGLLLALWGASGMFVALGDGLDKAYDVEVRRSFVKQRLVALGVMFAAVALMIVSSAVLLAGPQIAGALDLFGAAELAWSIAQWPLAFVAVVAAFWLVYYLLPNRDQKGCKKTLAKAAAIAAALWLLATVAFRFYIQNFNSYSETYGVLGAALVLLLWLYVTGLVVLAGGEVASEMEKD